MISAAHSPGISLADVMPNCLDALLSPSGSALLPPVRNAVVLLVDGLGAAALKAAGGHARTLASRLPESTIHSGFPSTTVAALASLTTGETPGQHGLAGYTVLDPDTDTVVNLLSGWEDSGLDPLTWQRCQTVFERAVAAGVSAHAVGAARYRDSGFTGAVLRGAEYHAAAGIAERFAAAQQIIATRGRSLVYVYVPELDQIGHNRGHRSDRWVERLEELDGAVRDFAATLGPHDGLLVTADHGMVDILADDHVLFDEHPRLIDGVRHIAGEPRCLQLHFEPDVSAAQRDRLVDAWLEAEGDRAWVRTREEAIAEGWFGRVDAEVAPRIGDLLVAARGPIAYYDSRVPGQGGRNMIGQHGSRTIEETMVPLLRFGAFA